MFRIGAGGQVMASVKYLSLCFRIPETGVRVASFTFHEDVGERLKSLRQASKVDGVTPILGMRKLHLRQKHDFH